MGDLVVLILYMFLLVIPLAQALPAFTTLQTRLVALRRIADHARDRGQDASDAPQGNLPTESIVW